MSTLPDADAAVKPRRSMRHTRLRDATSLITITEGKATDGYHVRAFLAPLGRAFRWTKLSGAARCGKQYDVLLPRSGTPTCDCPAGVYHGNRGPCRHVLALLALDARHELPVAPALE
jgi:hypothetical protein